MTFIVTHTNRKVDPWDLHPQDVDARDIAHALARICRFVGHSSWHYSVADHCLNVQRLLREQGSSPEVQLLGLLHDAPEAYLGDVASPTKAHLPDYKLAEDRAMGAIAGRFGATLHGHELCERTVKRADIVMLVTEARDLLPAGTLEAYAKQGIPPQADPRPLRRRFVLPIWRAEREYLRTLKALRIACGQEWLRRSEEATFRIVLR